MGPRGYGVLVVKGEATMGMLLRFSARTPRATPAVVGGHHEQARVLLFTGVRYERATSEPAEKNPRKQTGKGRAKR